MSIFDNPMNEISDLILTFQSAKRKYNFIKQIVLTIHSDWIRHN